MTTRTATPHAPLTQLDLPGQTHVAHGPNDHTGMYVMHHAFRRDLAAFASAVPATPLGDAETWAALARRWERFAFTLHHHHTVEDEIYWPALMTAVQARGTDADRAEVAAMSEEHADIDPLLAACGAGLRAVVEHPCAEHCNALGIRLAGLREVLGEHLRHEESVVLPLVQRTMTTEEFDVVEQRIGKAYPVRGIPFIVGWAMYGLPPHGQERMFATAGQGYRVLHALLRRRFARAEERTFRYGERGAVL